MKKILILMGVAALLATVNIGHAGLLVQTDTNSLAVASTNTYILAGDVTGSFTNGQTISAPLINNKNQSALIGQVGGFFTNSTAQSSNVVYTIASTVDGAIWTNAVQTVTMTIPASTTNWVGWPFTIAQPTYPIYGLRSVGNANTANITAKAGTIYFKVYSKDGI